MSRLDIRDINRNRIQLVDSSLASKAAVRIYTENEGGAEAVAWIDGKGWTPQPAWTPSTTASSTAAAT